ncbi:MAG: TetR/AcrR family transcriptional regulator [Marinibacterium sp.]
MPKIVDKQEMRGRILDAAMTCFLSKGFHATKMTDVADAADLAKGTLYLYFKGKDALMLALLERYFGDIQARIDQLPPPRSLSDFVHGLRLTMPVDRLDATRMFFDVLGPGFDDPRAAEIIGGFFDWLGGKYARVLRPLAAAGQVRRDLDPEAAGRALTAMLDGLVIHLALFKLDAQAFADRRDAAISLIEDGLRGPGPTPRPDWQQENP